MMTNFQWVLDFGNRQIMVQATTPQDALKGRKPRELARISSQGLWVWFDLQTLHPKPKKAFV